uniref:Large ribosomal subunit protein P2 n=2 Tax=Cyprinus carpio TaxID=7962 RepID=A0A8C1AFX7_CYPCA
MCSESRESTLQTAGCRIKDGLRPQQSGSRSLWPALVSISENAAQMRYVAAYLLAALGGKESPSTGDIKKILDSVGIEADDTRMSKVVSELNGKNLEEVIAQGFSKLASVPSGGAVAASSAAAPSAGGSAAAPAAEEKKEEKKEESEESEDDMGFGLFD